MAVPAQCNSWMEKRMNKNTEIAAKATFDQIRYAQLWEDADVLTSALGECAGKTLGVIGLGAIGCRVAELGTGLGMEVIACM